MKSAFKSWALAILFGTSLPLCLTGCQQALESQGFNADPAYWQNMQQRLAALSQIHLKGRFIYVSSQDKFSANFDYAYTAAGTYTLTLRSGIGTEIAKLIVNPQEAKLQASNREFSDTNPRALFQNAFDMTIPFEVLPQLILGIGLDGSIFTNQGILYQSTVDDFTVTYADYNSYGDIAVPKDFTILGNDMKLNIQTREVQILQ